VPGWSQSKFEKKNNESILDWMSNNKHRVFLLIRGVSLWVYRRRLETSETIKFFRKLTNFGL
jgi:hypothetical protein